MNVSWLRSRTLFGVVLLIAFSVFTADVVDLREELRFLSSPSDSLDNDITTGIADHASVEPEPLPPSLDIAKDASVDISFWHLFPASFRAPPVRSLNPLV